MWVCIHEFYNICAYLKLFKPYDCVPSKNTYMSMYVICLWNPLELLSGKKAASWQSWQMFCRRQEAPATRSVLHSVPGKCKPIAVSPAGMSSSQTPGTCSLNCFCSHFITFM